MRPSNIESLASVLLQRSSVVILIPSSSLSASCSEPSVSSRVPLSTTSPPCPVPVSSFSCSPKVSRSHGRNHRHCRLIATTCGDRCGKRVRNRRSSQFQVYAKMFILSHSSPLCRPTRLSRTQSFALAFYPAKAQRQRLREGGIVRVQVNLVSSFTRFVDYIPSFGFDRCLRYSYQVSCSSFCPSQFAASTYKVSIVCPR